MHRPAPYHREEARSPGPSHVNASETPFIKGTLRSPGKLHRLMDSEHELPPPHTESQAPGGMEAGIVLLTFRR